MHSFRKFSIRLKNTVRNTSRRIKVKPMCWTTFEAANAAKSSVSGPAWQRGEESNPRIRHRFSRSTTPSQTSLIQLAVVSSTGSKLQVDP
jgi:hypothetical protein